MFGNPFAHIGHCGMQQTFAHIMFNPWHMSEILRLTIAPIEAGENA
jgi:hypothetical protein